jgi:hypothetical protein
MTGDNSQCHGWDSNPHCTGFESVDSCQLVYRGERQQSSRLFSACQYLPNVSNVTNSLSFFYTLYSRVESLFGNYQPACINSITKDKRRLSSKQFTDARLSHQCNQFIVPINYSYEPTYFWGNGELFSFIHLPSPNIVGDVTVPV